MWQFRIIVFEWPDDECVKVRVANFSFPYNQSNLWLKALSTVFVDITQKPLLIVIGRLFQPRACGK